MEIKQESIKSRRRARFLWLIVLSCIALFIGVWQYHSLIVEVSDGGASSFYHRVMDPFRHEGDLAGYPLRVALLQSEYTAASFGERKDNYYRLLGVWERLLEREGFGYHKVADVPEGADIDAYNLLILPSASCLSQKQRAAVKAFLKAGKGVVMTWACGTRNEYGQWERYSLLQEIGGMDVVGVPPSSDEDACMAMLSGGYPITATLASGFHLDIMKYNQPLSCHVRESRVMIDGVWMDRNDPSFGLHSVRDRVAVSHGDYLGGRFVWMGFSVGSCRESPVQRDAFFSLIKNSMLWAGHQVQAFKPVWQNENSCVVSVTQNIYGPEDVDSRLIALLRRHRVPVTSFVVPKVMQKYPKEMAQLADLGEVGVLGDPSVDYRGLSQKEQERILTASAKLVNKLTGRRPYGFRPANSGDFSDHTLDALVRSGYEYISTAQYDRLVPKAVRSYRKIAVVTSPRILWLMPEMGYIANTPATQGGDNTMLSHFAQINALNGLYCLAIRPSQVDADFIEQLGELLARVRRDKVTLVSAHGVISEWSGWDQIKMTTRHLTAERTSLKISNTGRETLHGIVVYIELPYVSSKPHIESMTLGTPLPDSMSRDGIRWKLYFDKLSAGKNVTYYLDLPQKNMRQTDTNAGKKAEKSE